MVLKLIAVHFGQAGTVFLVAVVSSTIIAAIISGVFLLANTLITIRLTRKRNGNSDRTQTKRETRAKADSRKPGD